MTTCYYKVWQLNLLQSATTCYYKVWQLFYYKVWQVLLQSATGITKCDSFITKCDRYYKVRWLLQSATEHTFTENECLANFELKFKFFREFKETTHIQKYEKTHGHWLFERVFIFLRTGALTEIQNVWFCSENPISHSSLRDSCDIVFSRERNLRWNALVRHWIFLNNSTVKSLKTPG